MAVHTQQTLYACYAMCIVSFK